MTFSNKLFYTTHFLFLSSFLHNKEINEKLELTQINVAKIFHLSLVTLVI